MCGIFGASFKAGTFTPGRIAVFANNLGRLNDNRGGDSWGVCSIGDDGSIKIERGLGHLGNHGYALADHRNFFAHTRLGTVGKKIVENAHPFEIDDIIGAHNGGIHNHQEIARRYDRNFDVDSQHIFAHLSEGRDLGELTGYGAIEWINRNDPTRINLCRMTAGGDLAIFGIGNRETGETDAIVWSSNEKHLLEALYTSGIKNIFPFQVDEGITYYVRDGEVYLSNRPKIELSKYTHSSSYSGNQGCGVGGSATTSCSTNDDSERFERWRDEKWGKQNQQAASSTTTGGTDKDEPFRNDNTDKEGNELGAGG